MAIGTFHRVHVIANTIFSSKSYGTIVVIMNGPTAQKNVFQHVSPRLRNISEKYHNLFVCLFVSWNEFSFILRMDA